jgi:formylglycine-generating enzyme required for sulfatase activity
VRALFQVIAVVSLCLSGCDDASEQAPAADMGISPDMGCADCPVTCPEEADLPSGFVCLEGGEFWMGSPPSESHRAEFDEERHLVRINQPFLIATNEITQAEWTATVGNNPSYFSDGAGGCEVDPCDTRPVERINWHEAVAYANQRSEAEGLIPCYDLVGCDGDLGAGCEEDRKTCLAGFTCSEISRREACTGYRLPTEAEWEYAARGGNEEYRYGPIDDIAWYFGTARLRTHPVGGKDANGFGLFDVYGNVAEWTWDLFNQDYGFFGQADEAVDDPLGGEFGDTRIFRGCNHSTGYEICRAASRGKDFPAKRAHTVGLRLVRQLR